MVHDEKPGAVDDNMKLFPGIRLNNVENERANGL